MKYTLNDITLFFFIWFDIWILSQTNAQNNANFEPKLHLSNARFSSNEYDEFPDYQQPNRKDSALPVLQWGELPAIQLSNLGNQNVNSNGISTQLPDELDKNITWDSSWKSELNMGQISAVSIDPNGNIAIFHRGDRVWNAHTFNQRNEYDPSNGPIKQDTIILLDKTGKTIAQWGKNMFHLPHGLTIDSIGNYWITDVAMHQVFKFDAEDIQHHIEKSKQERLNKSPSGIDLTENNILKPSLILGTPFEPGSDGTHFCKPTAVAVQENGDFFVSDGYCNSRILKYNKDGEQILVWGRSWSYSDLQNQSPPMNAFYVPHALSLAEDLNYLFVADRENGRVQCFYTNNGTFHKQYKNILIGTKVYSIAYANRKLYVINGPDQFNPVHVRGFIIDIDSGDVLSQFSPGGDMELPHDIAVSKDGAEIYVVELQSHKIYRFLQKVEKKSVSKEAMKNSHHEPAPLTDINSTDSTIEGTATATLVLSLITIAVVFIAMCVALAAGIARYKKRGCLLTAHRRTRWEAERKENFRLSNLLESRKRKGFKFLERRPNTRDFSKLSTEPETSDDENPENSLTKII